VLWSSMRCFPFRLFQLRFSLHSAFPPAWYMSCLSHLPRIDFPNNIWSRVWIIKAIPCSCYFLSWFQIFSAFCSQTHSVFVFTLWWEMKFQTHKAKTIIVLDILIFRFLYRKQKLKHSKLIDGKNFWNLIFNFLVNVILICYCCSQIFELPTVLKV
jgi:hypothetical protein